MLKRITVSAPGKLILFGEHAVVYGKPCIVTSVEQRVQVEASFNGVNELVINAPQMGIRNYVKKLKDLGSQEMPKQVAFIEALVRRFAQKYGLKRGLNITTKADFSHTVGFGSSSAVTIAAAYALKSLYQVKLEDKKMFDLCFQAVLDIQGVGSGFDLAAALWGGTLFYTRGAKVVKSLDISHLPILVGYSGIKADTPTLVRQVAELKYKKPKLVNSVFNKIENIVIKANKALICQDWPEVGKLMQQNQKLLEALGVSTNKLEKLIKASIKAGAYGAKLSGAGGGDCIIALVDENKKQAVKKAINSSGGQVMRVRLNTKGAIC